MKKNIVCDSHGIGGFGYYEGFPEVGGGGTLFLIFVKGEGHFALQQCKKKIGKTCLIVEKFICTRKVHLF